MHVHFAAVAAWITAFALPLAAAAVEPVDAVQPLTLDDAIARVVEKHPDLRLIDSRAESLAAERDRVSLRPPLVAGAQVENTPGTGEYAGVGGAEVTLTLASVLERGGKRDARHALAQRRIDALILEREARRLDLLAEVARRFLAVNAARHQRDIAAFDIDQRQRAVAGARRRLAAGASPESVVLTAEAALARAELARDRAGEQERAARQHLAALWGEKAPAFDVAAVDPLRLPELDDAATLAALLENTPELAQFADERRIREARLHLARTAGTADLEWQVGARRLQASRDTALVASLSLPLGARPRATAEIRAAESELAALEIEREAKDLSLYSTLTEAHGRYRVAQQEVRRLREEVLPRLARAETAAGRAYAAGAISYMEWAQLQSEHTAMRQQQLDTAFDALRALIEIQRLTGQAFVAGPATTHGESP
ncbi:TolC family protein [Tahibacter amnicola]|uniref:TolC family protein n=1 Tax=Tahibacter amnicola TaxID=2976241 RepID=A0ABY6BAX6_9GAMM|nr:TolC family protein [Tahibacter amnicola]UXI66298.1 TolC family protein [Tahibacter amnicola]